MTYEIVFEPSGATVRVEPGTTLLDAAREAGVHIDTSCGGHGSCGKCRVRIAHGSASTTSASEKRLLTDTESAQGWRLACLSRVVSDMVVECPVMRRSVILEDSSEHAIDLAPAVHVVEVEMSAPSLEDARDDLTRLTDALAKTYPSDGTPDADDSETSLRGFEVDASVLCSLPSTLRMADWKVAVLLWRGERIIGVAPCGHARAYGLALDIGTTTIAAYLCDLTTGSLCLRASMMNPQIPYGADVLSRLSACGETADAELLRQILLDGLNSLVARMSADAEIHPTDIAEVTVACNTVMHHIALGLDAHHLGQAPYTPVLTAPIDMRASDFGLAVLPGGNVHLMPLIGNFVGADTTAALISEYPFPVDETTLLIDIGTNSEICLIADERLAVTSCATGPALEGAEIVCGMRAETGAIDKVVIDPLTLEPTIGTIGDGEPRGICGSGVIDAVAQMALCGIIEPSGSFSGNVSSPRVRNGMEGRREYILYEHGETCVRVTQMDVRAVQLAKAALYAGAQELLEHTGHTSVDNIILAGAFGSFLDKGNALALGMFLDCRLDHVRSVGNAAGLGARMTLLDLHARKLAETLVRDAVVVETAVSPDFQKRFADAMAIPHAHDAFFRNRPHVWHCNPGESHSRDLHMLPEVAFSEALAYADEKTLFPDGRNTGGLSVPKYAYTVLEDIDRDVRISDSPDARDALDSLADGKGEDTVFAVPGPMALLSTLIDPSELYRTKDIAALDETLLTVSHALSDYLIEAIALGARVISMADAEGCVELVGRRFFRQHTGPALYDCLKRVEPHLRHALIHLCGKSSVSLTGEGYATLKPYRVDREPDYLDLLFEYAGRRDFRILGNACIHTTKPSAPLLYRLELS